MKRRIPFNVCQASSNDKMHVATNLNDHAPDNLGWVSEKNCQYPQSIIINLKERCQISKMQILAHQSYISSRIEVFTAEDATNYHFTKFGFSKVGSFKLSDNSKSNHKSRELKTVFLEENAKLLKLVFQDNYPNEHNKYNQIGVIALNIIGRPLARQKNKIRNWNNAPFAEDLAFRMYQDVELAKLAPKLEEKRLDFINDDKLEEAKILKQSLEELFQEGLIVGKKVIRCTETRNSGDYALARKMDGDIADHRMRVYNKVKDSLKEAEGISAQKKKIVSPAPIIEAHLNESSNESEEELQFPDATPSPTLGTPEAELIIPDAEKEEDERREEPEAEPVPETQVKNSSFDDMVIPALAKKSTKEVEQEMYPKESFEQEEKKAIKKTQVISEKELEKASIAIDVFGQELVEKLYSKNFKDREDGISKVKVYLQLYEPKKSNHNPSMTMKATTFVLQKMSKDTVLSIVIALNELIQFVFDKFVPGHKVPRSEYAQSIDKLCPLLINRLGDNATRIKSSIESSLLFLNFCKTVKPLKTVPQHILQPFKSNNVSQKLAMGRCQLVDKLIREKPLAENKGLTVRQIVAFCLKALEHTSIKVREIAEAIIVLVYEYRGSEVRPCLPPDNEKTRKKPAFKRLFQKFDELDQEENQIIEDGHNEVLALRNELSKVPGGFGSRSSTNVKNNTDENASVADLREGALSRVNSSSQEVADIDFQKTCIFCGEKNENFTTEGLEMHYMQDCPMLICCKYCNQVVEISGLVEHHMTECDKKDDMKQCTRCKQVFPKREFSFHARTQTNCIAIKDDKIQCPLCKQPITPTEEEWKKHLTKPLECPLNPRRKNNPLSTRKA